MGGNGYALDLLSPIRHVATEMERAAPAALSIKDMAASYQHSIPGDLSRIRLHEGCTSDDDATHWLIGHAVEVLTFRGKGGQRQVEQVDGGYRLVVNFDELRYDRRKLHRASDGGPEEERRTLRAVYNDLHAERPFHVTVIGTRGGAKETRLRLHPLAHAIPQVGEKDFFELAADIKAHGVRNPITLFGGEVLDGRHRLAVASALSLPVRTVEFDGDETAARDEVISQNVQRRHLTIAQRGLIARELYLPQAEAEAEKRREATQGRPSKTERTNALSFQESAKAAEIAAKQANGLATARTIETMAPVDAAPKTQERIRSGEIKSAAEARREALKETGSDIPEDIPALRPTTAYSNLGQADGKIRDACKAIERGDRGGEGVTNEKLRARIGEIRARLDYAEELLQ
jgi:hypothetical protein